MLTRRSLPHLRSYCVIALLAVAVLTQFFNPNQHVKSAVSGFVTRAGTQLMLNGQPFRVVGPNIVWLGLDEVASQDPASSNSPDYPTTYRVDDALDTVLAMGGNVVRSHTLGISFGCQTGAGNSGNSNGKCLQPALGSYNEEAFRHVDYAIYAAGQRGIRLIIPLVDEFQYFHGGRYTFTTWRGVAASSFYSNATVINDFKGWITHLLNRVNTYNNIRYKDDPTIMAWETGNELSATTSWTQEVTYHIRTQDTKHLIVDGTYGINANSLLIPYVDIYSDHFYPMSVTKLNNDAAAVQAANKVFFIGEYAWRPNPADPPGDTLTTFLTGIENSTASGDTYWALFPHRGNYSYMMHSDGNISYTVHYPGDPGDSYMTSSVQSLRNHAYRMRGILTIPAHSIPPAPQITDIWGNAQIFIRGAAGAHTYSVERANTSTGTWTVVCNQCTDAFNSWTDPTYPGSGVTVWYRVRAHNGDGVAGPYSEPYKAATSKPTSTPTIWPTNAATPTSGPATQTFTPMPPTATATSTPQSTGTFYKGININGSAVTIEGNLWLSYTDAKAQGFTVGPEANPDTKSLTPNPATDSATSSMLNSLVYTFTDLHFTQTIPNGNYQLYLWTMENYASNVRSWNLNLEGITAGRELGNLAMNQWAKYGPFNTTVSDGILNIDLVHVNSNPMLMGLAIYSGGGGSGPTLTPSRTNTPLPTNTPCVCTNTPVPPTATRTNTPIPPTATRTNTPLPSNTPTPISFGAFVKGVNINGNAVTIEGNAWLAYSTALSQGLSQTGGLPDTKSLTPNPATDAATSSMLNSLLYSSSDPGTISLAQTIANGTYQVYIWEMENFQANSRSINLKLEGVQLASGLGMLPLNGWAKYGPYQTTISDGALNIDLVATQGRAMIMGFAIFTNGTGPTNTPIPPTATKTNTPVPTFAPPTNTPSGPTATKTNTPVPPTNTNTAIPPTSSGTNIAPSGTGYTWFNISTTYAGNQRNEAGVNNGNLTADFALTGGGDDNTAADEAAGVIWSATQTISSVKYYNGTCDQYANAPFTANLRIQFSTNGTTWTTDSAWTVSPAYPYDSCTAGGQIYTFSGPVKTGVKGVRVIGTVHSTGSSLSWHAKGKEVQVFN